MSKSLSKKEAIDMLGEYSAALYSLRSSLSAALYELEDDTCSDCGMRWPDCQCATGEWWRNAQWHLKNTGEDQFPDRRTSVQQLEQKLKKAKEVFQAITDFDPKEVVFDEFAYNRLKEAFKEAAKTGLSL